MENEMEENDARARLKAWYDTHPAPSMSVCATQADYWKAMYEHREAEAHELGEHIRLLEQKFAAPFTTTNESIARAADSNGEVVAPPFDSEYVHAYLESVLEEMTGNVDPEMQKLLAWLSSGVPTSAGNARSEEESTNEKTASAGVDPVQELHCWKCGARNLYRPDGVKASALAQQEKP